MDNTTTVAIDNAGSFDITKELLENLIDISNLGGNGTTENDLSYFASAGTTYIIFNVIIVALGLVGNFMVMVLTNDEKFSYLSFPIYLRFLAVSDSIVLIMLSIQEWLRYFESLYRITDHKDVCRIWKTSKYTVMLLSPWLVVGLTVDRFYCVVFPLTRDRFCTRTKAAIVCSTLTTISIVLMLPLLDGVSVVKGSSVCFIVDQLVPLYAVIRMFLNSLLPCLLILIFNIVIAVHIQRSATFRKRFTSSTNNPTQDKSLRPLILISVLAFVMIIPSGVAESVLGIMLVTKADPAVIKNLLEWWPVFNIPFLMNFGQNFYILMASSGNYRKVMKNKLAVREAKGKSGSFTAGTVCVELSDRSDSKRSNSAGISLQSASISSPDTDGDGGSKKG